MSKSVGSVMSVPQFISYAGPAIYDTPNPVSAMYAL